MYSYEQGKIDGGIAENKFSIVNPDWVDLNIKVKQNYPGADFWKPVEMRENIAYGPNLELKLRRCEKVDPYKRQMKESLILAVEFYEDGIRDSSTSRGLGDVYKRQIFDHNKQHKSIEYLFL